MKKALKRSLSLLLAITIIFGSAYVGLSEVDFANVFAVKVKAVSSGTCGDNLTWTLDDEGTLTISGTGDMRDASLFHNTPWFSIQSSIKRIIINNGVTSIGNRMFYNFTNLTSVIIPTGLTSIGEHAFNSCTSLKFLIIPDSVTSIGAYAFSNCASLTSITIPSNITSIDEGVFDCCKSLTSITLPKNVIGIGYCAFNSCTKLNVVNYCGNKTQWNSINIDPQGNESLLSANIVFNYNISNNGDFEDGFSFSNFMFDYHLNYNKGYYQTYLNSFNSDFGSESMVCSASGTKLEKDIDAWYTVKSVANPGNALNLLNYQQQYEMIIYGILFDTLSNEDLQSTSYSNAVTDVSKFTTDLVDKWNMADVLDKTDLTGAECQEVKDAAIAFIGNADTKWTALGEYTSLVGKVSGAFDKFIKPGVDIYNVIQKVSMLNQLMNLGNEGISYLYLLKDYSTDPFMKTAIQEVIDSVSNDWVGIVEKVVLDVGFEFNKAAISALVDAGWGAVCAVNPFLAGMAIGDVAGTFVCNVFLATEDTIEQYSNMKKIVEIKKTVRALQTDLDNLCKTHMNNDNTSVWVFSLGFMNSLLETDYRTSVEFGRVVTQKGVVNFFINLFSSKQEQTFNEYKDTIEEVIARYDSQYRFLFNNSGIKIELCTTYPQYYSSCYPTPVSEFYYTTTNNSVTITGVKSNRFDYVIPDEIDGKPVTAISYGVFDNAPDIDVLILGKNVTDISNMMSYLRNDFAYIYVVQENPKYCSVDGSLFSKDKKILYRIGNLKDANYTIPYGVTTIGECAFAKEPGLESITIPANVTIGKGVFSHCSDLKTVVIKKGLKIIPDDAFYNCTSLTSVTIPDSVTNIGEYAFASCDSLKSITIPGSVKNINENVFYSCSNLESVVLRDGVTLIDNGAFSYCPVLKTIVLPSSLNKVWRDAFYGCVKLQTVNYAGNSTQWSEIDIDLFGNDCLLNATKVFNYGSKPTTPKVATTNEIGGVQVTWNKVAGATKYVVFRRQGGYSTWVNVGTTTDNTLLDKNVKSGIFYVYSVRAYNSAGKYSDFVSANTNTRKYMATPKLTTIYNHVNGLAIKWNAVAGVTKGYRVYRRGAGSTYWTYLGTTKNLYFIDSQVKNRNGEYFRYTVIADGGYHSKFDTTGLYLRRLANPTLNSAVSSKSGITVKWGKVAGSSGYYVYRKTANSTWTRIAVVKGVNGLSYLDKTAKKGTTYTYTVRAVYGNTLSSYYSGISCKDRY